jgi:hypothetical protein
VDYEVMQVSELIETLQEIEDRFGDIPIFIASKSTWEEALLEDILVVSDENGNYELLFEIE